MPLAPTFIRPPVCTKVPALAPSDTPEKVATAESWTWKVLLVIARLLLMAPSRPKTSAASLLTVVPPV